jgi:heptaprenylglyceryl phosphate synthase
METNKFPGKTSIALLLDPDKIKGDELKNILGIATKCRANFILTGGSLTFSNIDQFC